MYLIIAQKRKETAMINLFNYILEEKMAISFVLVVFIVSYYSYKRVKYGSYWRDPTRCPYCKTKTMILFNLRRYPEKGEILEVWKCSKCKNLMSYKK